MGKKGINRRTVMVGGERALYCPTPSKGEYPSRRGKKGECKSITCWEGGLNCEKKKHEG